MPDREKVIKGLEFTKAMITFNPSTGEDIEPGNLNEEDKTTYDACVGAITLLKEQETVKPKKIRGYNLPMYTFYEYECEKCKTQMLYKQPFCMGCGKDVNWNELSKPDRSDTDSDAESDRR